MENSDVVPETPMDDVITMSGDESSSTYKAYTRITKVQTEISEVKEEEVYTDARNETNTSM